MHHHWHATRKNILFATIGIISLQKSLQLFTVLCVFAFLSSASFFFFFMFGEYNHILMPIASSESACFYKIEYFINIL